MVHHRHDNELGLVLPQAFALNPQTIAKLRSTLSHKQHTMNTALSNSFENFCGPTNAATASFKPIPIFDDLDDDIHFLPVLHPRDGSHVSTPLPSKNHPVLDVDRTVVSTSLIRRIEHEMRNDDCDPRTVFNFCRGLTKGSLEFEEAYIAARIRSFAKHQRIATDPLLATLPDAEGWLLKPRHQDLSRKNPAPPHPFAVNNLGHLMRHFGIWVMGLLGLQILAAWRIGAFASTYLEGGRIFYFLLAAFLMTALDSMIWFRRRGSLCDAFLVPGFLLCVMALLPVIILYVRETILALR